MPSNISSPIDAFKLHYDWNGFPYLLIKGEKLRCSYRKGKWTLEFRGRKIEVEDLNSLLSSSFLKGKLSRVELVELVNFLDAKRNYFDLDWLEESRKEEKKRWKELLRQALWRQESVSWLDHLDPKKIGEIAKKAIREGTFFDPFYFFEYNFLRKISSSEARIVCAYLTEEACSSCNLNSCLLPKKRKGEAVILKASSFDDLMNGRYRFRLCYGGRVLDFILKPIRGKNLLLFWVEEFGRILIKERKVRKRSLRRTLFSLSDLLSIQRKALIYLEEEIKEVFRWK